MPQATPPSKKSVWKNYWPVGVVIVLVVIGWYLASGSAQFESQASRPGATSVIIGDPREASESTPSEATSSTPVLVAPTWQPRWNRIEKTVAVATDYGRATLGGSDKANFDNKFELLVTHDYSQRGRAVDSFDYAVLVPDIATYSVESVRFKAVQSQRDCRNLATGEVARPVRNSLAGYRRATTVAPTNADVPQFLGRINLNANPDDYGQYYCFRVQLTGVYDDGDWTSPAERHFVTRYPVDWLVQEMFTAGPLEGRGAYKNLTVRATEYFLDNFAGISKADASRQVDRLRLSAGRDHSHATRLVHSVMPYLPTNSASRLWSLGQVRYLPVTAKSQCQASLFATQVGSASVLYPAEGFFLPALSSIRQSYCIKVDLRLALRDGADVQPSKLLAQRIFWLTWDNSPIVDNSNPSRAIALNSDFNLEPADFAEQERLPADQRVNAITDYLQTGLHLATNHTPKGLGIGLYLPNPQITDPTTGDAIGRYEIKSLRMGKVAQVDDCRFLYFDEIEEPKRRLDDTDVKGNDLGIFLHDQGLILPVGFSERGARYCFNLRVDFYAATQPDEVKYSIDLLSVMSHPLGVSMDFL